MATRSFIARANADGTYTAIYCHWNGKPEWNGATLRQHYTDPVKLAALLALGALSMLGEELGKRHRFATALHDHPTWCIAFGRDRGDTGDGIGSPLQLPDAAALIEAAQEWDAEYIYVWHAGAWWLMNRYGALRDFDTTPMQQAA